MSGRSPITEEFVSVVKCALSLQTIGNVPLEAAIFPGTIHNSFLECAPKLAIVACSAGGN